MNCEKQQKILRYCGWLGIISVFFYFLHILVGTILYENYNPIKQAISDLTANGAPSEIAARTLSGLYGVFNIFFAIAFYLFYRKKINKVFSLAALLFIIMAAVSGIGYMAFPLSTPGFENSFQDKMHATVTIIVVILSISALVLFAIGYIRHKKYKWMGYAAITTLGFMMTGSILLSAIPAIMGIGERINIYALQIYTVLLSIFLLRYKDNQEKQD